MPGVMLRRVVLSKELEMEELEVLRWMDRLRDTILETQSID